MEYKDLCFKVIEKEIKNFEHEVTKHSTFEFESTAVFTENFDIPYNRCIYLSRYGNSCIHIFKDSMEKFLSDSPDAKDIVSEWKSHAEVRVCSLSTGPGLDYLAFMLSILKYDPLSPNFSGATVISKYGAWQNTVNFMLEVLREQGSVCGIPWSKFNYNIEVIQTDDLIKCFSGMINVKNEQAFLSNTHIVLMMRTLNLYAFGLHQETSILQMLKELVSSLRSDATIFCVDTIPSLALFNQAFSCFPGKFLYSPIHQTYKIPVSISEDTKCCPETYFSGTFFVWRKLPYTFIKFPSLGMTILDTDCEKKKPTTAHRIKGNNFFTAEKSKQNIKTSEILPWRELPLCKIPWGKLFWENASPTTKKSLRSVMSLKKESLERHWISEVANLYMKEYGTPKFSNLSEGTEKVVTETFVESNRDSAQMDNEILVVPNALMTSHSTCILKEEICDSIKPGSIILEENSFDIASSSMSSDFLRTIDEFKPIKCDLVSVEKDSFGQESNKGEMHSYEALKQSPFDADLINDASRIEMAPLNTNCETGKESSVCKAGGNSEIPFFKLHFSTSDKCNEKPKAFKILPWKDLPPGKIPWGEIFWQNASSRMKKSLKSLLSLKKEDIEHHWIGKVDSFYLKEYGTLNAFTSSAGTDKNVTSKSSHKSTSQSMHMITEKLNIPNTSSQSDNLKSHDTNIKNALLEEISFDATRSSPSLDFNCQPIKCDLTIQATDSLIQNFNKRDIGLPMELKEISLPNPMHMKAKTNYFQKTPTYIDTIQTNVNETIQSAKIKRPVQPPFESELSQANIPEIQKIDPSIEALTESIKQLVKSIESVTRQNRSKICNKTNCHQSFRSCHNHQMHSNAAKINNCNNHITCTAHCSTKISAESRQNSSSSIKHSQYDNSFQCSSLHCRCQCCHNKYNSKSLLFCHSRVYNGSSCHCSFSKQLPCSENQPLMKSPNIVIPIQNVTEDVLLEIVSILKTDCQSG